MTSPNEEPRDDTVAEGTPSASPQPEGTPGAPPAPAASTPPTPPADDVAAEIEKSLETMKKAPVDDKEIARREQGGGGGDPLSGTVVKIDGNDVFVELGPRMQGLCSLADFEAPPEVGSAHEFTLRGRGEDGLLVLGRRSTKQPINWDEVQMGNVVSATVVGQNTGGLELKIGPALAGFMPASQLDLHRVEDLGAYIGQKIDCRVLEVDRRRKRLLVSRRAILEEEVADQRKGFVSELTIGQIVEGTVRRFESFGAFVELKPGVEGLLHVSNISRQRVKKPQDVLSEGQKVECAVLEIKNGGRRIGLGMKQLEPNPWDTIETRLPPETVVKGKVKRIADFGAFVEIEDGVEGLVHISQLSSDRIRTVGDAVKEGEEFEVRVLSIDSLQERVSLSRLTDTGHVIGSPEAESGEPAPKPSRGPNKGGGGGGKPRRDRDEVPADVKRNQRSGSGTNLGSLLRQALGDDED